MVPFIGVFLKLALGPVMDVVGKYIDKQADRDKLKAEVEQALIGAGTALAAQQASVIVTEARGESWLQRNWRPVVALVSFFSCWFVIFPYAFFVQWGWLPQVRFGEAGLQYFFTLTTVCVGGYIGGRTLEKMAGRT
jgi:Holin of 3TMs, for gene-transfer release